MVWINRYGDPKLAAMVFLHGFMGAKEDWQPLMAKMSLYYHCICIDLPGHGGNQYRLPTPGLLEAAEHIFEAVTQLGYQNFHLVGYSLGGRIALHIAKQQPHALLSLVLESAHPGLQNELDKQQRILSDKRWADRLNALPLKQFLSLWYQQAVFSDLTSEQRQWLISKRQSNNQQHLHACYQATSLGWQQDCRDVLQQLKCPSYFISGEQDKKFQKIASNWLEHLQQSAQANIPTSSVEQTLISQPHVSIIAGVGHNIHSIQPQMFADRLLLLLRDDPQK